MPPAAPTRLARLAPALVALGAVLLGLAWALGSPAGSSADEDDHIKYAWATVTGQAGPWGAQEQVVDGRTWTDVTYPAEILEIQDPACYRFDRTTSVCGIVEATEREDGTVAGGSGMTRYPLLYYYPMGWVLQAGLALGLDGIEIITAARVVSALMCLALLAAGAWLLSRRVDRRALVLVGALPLVPVAWNFFAAVNPNGFEIAAAMLLAAAGAGARIDVVRHGRIRGDLLVALPVAAFLLSMCRPLSAPWACAILLLVLIPVGALRARDRPWHRRILDSVPFLRTPWWWQVLSVLTILAGLAWFVWTLSVRGGEAGEDRLPYWESLPEPVRTLVVVLYLGPTVQFAFGRMGWVDTDMPLTVFLVWVVLVAWALTRTTVGRQAGPVTLRVVLAVVATATAIMWIQSYASAFAWQGRYYLPILAAGLVACVAAVQGRGIGSRALGRAAVVVAWVMAAITVFGVVWNALRYMYGFRETISRFDLLPWAAEPPLWNPFPSAAVVFAMAAVGAVLAAGGATWWVRTAPPAVRIAGVPDAEHGAADPVPEDGPPAGPRTPAPS